MSDDRIVAKYGGTAGPYRTPAVAPARTIEQRVEALLHLVLESPWAKWEWCHSDGQHQQHGLQWYELRDRKVRLYFDGALVVNAVAVGISADPHNNKLLREKAEAIRVGRARQALSKALDEAGVP